ncbi:hypothetical protein [Burkholderia gladioli]|uniref:hypothetical protein n=1 Tax=Burkholderia gladioli TaxID=28095 RepID=UPI00163EA8C3|nr:hypothetical protein [Burkholderia gladioli]
MHTGPEGNPGRPGGSRGWFSWRLFAPIFSHAKIPFFIKGDEQIPHPTRIECAKPNRVAGKWREKLRDGRADIVQGRSTAAPGCGKTARKRPGMRGKKVARKMKCRLPCDRRKPARQAAAVSGNGRG